MELFVKTSCTILLTGLFFLALTAGQAVEMEEGAVQVTPVPTADRLAAPALPENPGQADYGAQAYWLHCMPCHGDRGQGLTAEFRNLYPPEDRNCWNSGCHGERPYEDGFTLPTNIPELIGPGALTNFATALNLYAFVHAAMPFQAPASLDEETYWTIIAFLIRENDIGNAPALLFRENADGVLLHQDSNAPVTPSLTAEESSPDFSKTQFPSPARMTWAILAFFLVELTIAVFIHKSGNLNK
jgi:hypothetical protein